MLWLFAKSLLKRAVFLMIWPMNFKGVVMQNSVTFQAENEQQTVQFAQKVAQYAFAGDFIRLEGTLGMGKTTFARAFFRALAGDDALAVPSPTFNLMQVYDETRLPVVHVDAYRMGDGSELEMLDLTPYYANGVTLMEWCSNVEDGLPVYTPPSRYVMESEVGDFLTITLGECPNNVDARQITLEANGTWRERFGLMVEGLMRPQTQKGRMQFLAEQGFPNQAVVPTSQDCSFRTYHRTVIDGVSHVVMDAPPPVEKVTDFITAASYFQKAGLKVPNIIKQDPEKGYLLLEDLGTTSLAQVCQQSPEMQGKWLGVAVDALLKLANQKPADVWTFSADSCWQEAKRFTDWYLPYVKGHATHIADREAFKNAWYSCFEHFKNLPQTTCHYDYHVDNLMCLNPEGEATLENLAVIDFQDARVGPVTLDMACLLEDRFPAGEALKEQLIDKFLQGLKAPLSREAFDAGYTLNLLHRFFKITGLLVRLQERDGRENVLGRMAEAWQVIDKCLQHPACKPVRDVMDKIYPDYKERGKKWQK